jgi:hypothetical protein
MPDLGILNTLIAMVIVILVLSLIVQSIQTLIKKFFKLKSRTILNSLEDLFQTITQNPKGESAPGADPGKAQQLIRDVTDNLRQMGRETLRGKLMLDSLAKGDLLKVLTRVEAENLLPGAVEKFGAVLTTIRTLTGELQSIDTALLEGDASAKFAAMQASLLPLIDDIEALAGGGEINPRVLLGDLNRLRQIKTADVLGLLGEVQKKVGQDLAAARAAGVTGDGLKPLEDVSNGLKRIAEQITALGQAFDAALVPLRERLEQAEVWYDTVMQGFEERYTRHMRTVALVISIFVVVLLNANFFTIYQAMSNPETAEEVASQGEDILQRSRQATAAQKAAATSEAAGTNASPTPPAPAATPQDATTTTAQPSPAGGSTPAADLQKQGQETKGWIDTYKSFGITPLTRQQLRNFFKGEYKARDVSGTFAGWLIMVMLLSAGAPFWQDTLESLFGLKNLLRQRSDTQNIEGGKGGQPNP